MQMTFWGAFFTSLVDFSFDYAETQLRTETMQILFVVSGLDLSHTHVIRFKV